MLNSKQIYNRLNRVYQNEFEGDKPENDLSDEWYGTETETEWKWFRPSEKKYYKMELDLETKAVTCYSKSEEHEEWHEDFVLRDKEY